MTSKVAKKMKFTHQVPTVAFLTRPRAGSEELGDMDSIKYNSRTGRPIRSTAGRKSLDPFYKNTIEAVDMMSDEESEDNTEEVEDEEGVISTKKKSRNRLTLKRKRSPSPPPPPLSPAQTDYETLNELIPDSTIGVPEQHLNPERQVALPSIHLNITIPPGFTGPLHIELDPSMLLQPSVSQVSHVSSEFMPQSTSIKDEKGFLDIPAELRNQIYRHLLVKESNVSFAHPRDFSRTSAILRTCRQVYEEARGILYGENEFRFERDHRSLRQKYDISSNEVGYKMFMRVLMLIGPHNISKLRKLVIQFDDQQPRNGDYKKSKEERRYVHDPFLIECLKMLSQHSKLMSLTLEFYGRRTLSVLDLRFLEYLCAIKADHVVLGGSRTYMSYSYSSPLPRTSSLPLNRIDHELVEEIKNTITRKTKLYPDLYKLVVSEKEKGKEKEQE